MHAFAFIIIFAYLQENQYICSFAFKICSRKNEKITNKLKY